MTTPADPQPPKSVVTYAVVVNSCVQYAGATLPPLLESLRAAGVPARDVFVVAGQATKARDGTVGPPDYAVRVAYRPWWSVDNNGFAWLAEDDGAAAVAPYDWIFYLHDTTVVEPGFREATARLCAEAAPRCQALKLYGQSMSMGAYRTRALAGLRDALRGLRNDDPAQLLDVKIRCEDSVFRLLDPAAVTVLPNAYRELEAGTPYGTSTLRRVEVWALPGLRKFKANWGQAYTCAL